MKCMRVTRVPGTKRQAHYETETQADIEFLRAGGKNFCAPELAYLGDLAQWCGRAIHLQCAGGRDTLSLWNLGAQTVVGVDINARMLACAAARRRLSAYRRNGIAVTF